MKRYIALLLSVLLLCSAAACTTRDPAETAPVETAEPTPTPTPEPTEPPAPTEPPEPEYRDLFNGAGRDEPNTGRPFAVMINNLKQAQPQCATSRCDILYEVLAEGGVTRMMAIYSDIRGVEHIGSIRSIRPYYIDISLAYGAVTCHAGGSDAAYSRIRSEHIENIDGVRGVYPFEVFYRDQQRRASGYAVEHTLFTEGDNLYRCAEELKYDLTLPEGYDTGLRFVKDGTPADGAPAAQIDVTFNSGKSTALLFHEDTGLYTAQQHGGDYLDGNTDEPVTFRNVLAISAATRVLDGYGRLSVNLIGSGSGYFACGGSYVEISWARESLEDCFHYYLADGSELHLGEGTTYIAVLAENTSSISFT